MNKKQPRIKVDTKKIDLKIIELKKTRTQIAGLIGISGTRFNDLLREGFILEKHRAVLETILGEEDWYAKK